MRFKWLSSVHIKLWTIQQQQKTKFIINELVGWPWQQFKNKETTRLEINIIHKSSTIGDEYIDSATTCWFKFSSVNWFWTSHTQLWIPCNERTALYTNIYTVQVSNHWLEDKSIGLTLCVVFLILDHFDSTNFKLKKLN